MGNVHTLECRARLEVVLGASESEERLALASRVVGILADENLPRDVPFVEETGCSSSHGVDGTTEASSIKRWPRKWTSAFVAQTAVSWLKLPTVYTRR